MTTPLTPEALAEGERLIREYEEAESAWANTPSHETFQAASKAYDGQRGWFRTNLPALLATARRVGELERQLNPTTPVECQAAQARLNAITQRVVLGDPAQGVSFELRPSAEAVAEIEALSCDAQLAFAERIASNIGMVVRNEPEHPDSPHHPNREIEHLTARADAAEAREAKLREALTKIARVGDGFGPHDPPRNYAGTTGEGHAECRELARDALGRVE